MNVYISVYIVCVCGGGGGVHGCMCRGQERGGYVCGWVWVYMCVGCVCCFVCGWVWVYMCVVVSVVLYVGGYGCTCV